MMIEEKLLLVFRALQEELEVPSYPVPCLNAMLTTLEELGHYKTSK